jgi:hypothetical protein
VRYVGEKDMDMITKLGFSGFLVFWFSGFLVFWFSGFLVFWFSGFRVFGLVGLYLIVWQVEYGVTWSH